ncbi:TrmH family RNA methyltransferase [Cohnella abietis]|uniref:23S rRNA methyltransferase n=1 Tax=Cohnella abietis TaxID=2507935 RepID=A0A3T1DAM0_9BACL|nr:RNA methyltransferase [Cohnella abietis]BBI35166.1 23S rRNA methyltransferase [Cohnella abietis]
MRNLEGYISSAANPRVKEWAKLLERKYREREGKFLLEGIHLVKEALDAQWPLEVVAFDEGSGVLDTFAQYLEHEHKDGPAWIPVSPDIIMKCSETGTPQPIFAVALKRPPSAELLFGTEGGLVAVLDAVQDPGNVGTIVRSAAASGATAVVLGKGTVDLYNPKTIRATMGAIFHVPVLEADLSELLPEAAAQGVSLVGTSLQAAQSCYDYDFRCRNVWLVFGNEGSGVSEQVSELVHANVIIPMTGRAESLNVAMASTLLLFEAQRQRNFTKTIIPVHQPK